MDEDFLDLLLLFEFSLLLSHATEALPPIFLAFFFAFGILDYSLERVNTLSHPSVELRLYCMDMIVDELAEASQVGALLLNSCSQMISSGQF